MIDPFEFHFPLKADCLYSNYPSRFLPSNFLHSYVEGRSIGIRAIKRSIRPLSGLKSTVLMLVCESFHGMKKEFRAEKEISTFLLSCIISLCISVDACLCCFSS
ncbi:hypothetical protein Syun_011977 [Stephania yunnanensis]|uniref:Uncharacterized protein n=1 Tax=Stephania yunnanensis TaxID=152371 RepID=A0AAP0K115_9MAGN